MKQIDWERRNPTKQQVSGPTIDPKQIKKNLGVTLTKQQSSAFYQVSHDMPQFINVKVKDSLVKKNLCRFEKGRLVLTEKGKAYKKIQDERIEKNNARSAS